MKIYQGTLYRYGYELTVIGETEKAVRTALIKEYNRAYKDLHGCHPTKEEIKNRNADIDIKAFTIGHVEWM